VAKEGGNKKSKKLAIILIAVSVVVAIGAISVVFMTKGGNLTALAANFQKDEEYVLQMDSFVVNLSKADQTNEYLKVQLSLVYTDKKKADILALKSSQIRDVIIKDLMEYTSEQLLMEGGLDNAKEKLKADINKELGEEVVTGICITDFLIQ
jgi:flagellar protein FliL